MEMKDIARDGRAGGAIIVVIEMQGWDSFWNQMNLSPVLVRINRGVRSLLAGCGLLACWSQSAATPATISSGQQTWTLGNEVLEAKLVFTAGGLQMTRFLNREAKVDYLANQGNAPLFTHVVDQMVLAANDGGWALVSAEVYDISCYGQSWGQRLELTLARKQPTPFLTRQVFEIYHGRAALRYYSFVKNDTDREVTVESSEVLALPFPDKPHELFFGDGIARWNVTTGGLVRGGRNGIVRYGSGDGWFAAPENNWCTSLTPGLYQGNKQEKLLWLNLWSGGAGLRVITNPKAVQLVLFPREEVEYFAVNLGVFSGDDWDGRVAVAEHLRQRFKYHDPVRRLSVNDWRWGAVDGKRSDANYRNIVIPRAAAAGFDLINIDAEWYTEDGTDPADNWTDMISLCAHIIAQGMKPGHWFPLQGKGGSCHLCWANGRDVADPANVDFKLKQTEETLIAKYHSAWGQLDCGLLWKTDAITPYSHPSDSVYRKLLGMRRYMNTVTHQQPDFLMQVTCEIDNPAGDARASNQSVGLAHLADNGIVGMFRRTDSQDDVRDLFDCVGLLPLEGTLSTWGGDGITADSWQDSPLWYYQFLLARHTSIYSWPGDWSPESIAHLRVFNDWRKTPRIQALLSELLRPVYNGPDRLKNEGPWVWMFTDERRTKALVVALNHLGLSRQNPVQARLRWLDPAKTYAVEDITMVPGGKFAHAFRGVFPGGQLRSDGLAIDLVSTHDRCAAYWIEEVSEAGPAVLYADAGVTSYTEKTESDGMVVALQGNPHAAAVVIVYKPAGAGVETRTVALDATGAATAKFDARTITETARGD